MNKLTLSDEERALVRRLPDKIGYVAVINFARGPRGARFRPSRSKVYATLERAERENTHADLQRRFRTTISSVELHAVDALGRLA